MLGQGADARKNCCSKLRLLIKSAHFLEGSELTGPMALKSQTIRQQHNNRIQYPSGTQQRQ
jgi:hypothetical protein